MYECCTNRRNWVLCVLPLLCGWMIGCEAESDDDVADDDTTMADDDDSDSECAVPLDFQELMRSEDSGDYGAQGWVDCHAIVISVLESQHALELAYQELLPNVPANEIVTSVDFATELVLLSYAEEGCPDYGFTLVMNSICLEESTLLVHETLIEPEMGVDLSARVYNVTSIPAGEYEDVDLILTVEYPEP